MGPVLLISNSTNPGEGYLDHCADVLEAHFAGVDTVAFVPYALADLDGYADTAEQRFASIGIDLVSVHRDDDPASVVARCGGVFVGGGNTFRLLRICRSLGLLEAIDDLVAGRGGAYAGASAGSNLACPTIKTTNDMPIVDPGGFDSLGIFPFQVNAHYVDRDPDVAHNGETRMQRIAEFHEENETPVIGLYEGAILQHDNGSSRLLRNRALLFTKGNDPMQLRPGDSIQERLAEQG